MAQFLAAQTKTNETVTVSINQLTSKFDVMATHQKAMDTQIAQIAQQVSHLSPVSYTHLTLPTNREV